MQDEAKETEGAMILRLQSELAKLDAANKMLNEQMIKTRENAEIKEKLCAELMKRNMRLEGEREAYGDILDKLSDKLVSQINNR